MIIAQHDSSIYSRELRAWLYQRAFTGNGYAVISGDGSGVTSLQESHKCQVAFEFKYQKPGKERGTDIHNALPVYYSTQVLSQMSAK